MTGCELRSRRRRTRAVAARVREAQSSTLLSVTGGRCRLWVAVNLADVTVASCRLPHPAS